MRCVFLFLLLTRLCEASLVWTATQVQLTPDLGQKEATAVFGFENAGSAPVTITEISSSCGCTVPALEKRTYQPGERGEITATYSVGNRSGFQQSSVTVVTDAPEANRIVLKLRVEIPLAVEIVPRVLVWKLGESAAEKQVRIRAHPSLKPQFTEVVAASPGFVARIEAGGEPGEAIVVVTPVDTAEVRRATLEVRTAEALPGVDRLTIWAMVR